MDASTAKCGYARSFNIPMRIEDIFSEAPDTFSTPLKDQGQLICGNLRDGETVAYDCWLAVRPYLQYKPSEMRLEYSILRLHLPVYTSAFKNRLRQTPTWNRGT